MTMSCPDWWPRDFASIYEPVVIAWRVDGDIIRRQRLTEGKSGAFVAVVSAKIDGDTRSFILRLLKVQDVGAPLGEINTLERVYALVPQYAKRAIPKVLYHFHKGELLAFAQEIVAGGLEFVDALRNLPSINSPYAYKQVSLSLLDDFNAQALFEPKPQPLTHIAQRWLNDRQLSSVLSRVTPQLLKNDTDPSKPSFAYADMVLPNPFLLVASSQLRDFEIIPRSGLLHGDLNGNNILLSRVVAESRQTHWLIDFTHFKENSPLLFDHAYLEVSELLHHLEFSQEHLIRKAINRCATLVQNDHDFTARNNADIWSSLYPLSFISAGVEEWIDTKAAAQRADLRKQYLLARVCAALNFANKRHDEPFINVLSLLLSSAFAQSLVSFLRIPWSKENSEIVLRAPASKHFYDISVPSNVELADFLDHDDSYTILVAGPQTRFDTEQTKLLSQTELHCLIDLSKNQLADVKERIFERKKALAFGIHTIVPGSPIPDFDPPTSFVWLELDYDEAADSKTYSSWRRSELRRLRDIFGIIAKSEFSRVSVVILGFSQQTRALETLVLELLDEVGPERLAVCVLTGLAGEFRACFDIGLLEGTVDTLVTEGDAQRYVLAQALVSRKFDRQPLAIPRRTGDTVNQRVTLTTQEQTGFAETFDLIHGGLASISSDGQEPEFDFLLGCEISWREIEDHFDVDRDQFSELLGRVETVLHSNRSGSIALIHGPGAGGTTLARRVAWTLKDRFPTVLLRKKLEHTSARLQELYSLSGNLPFLAIVESSLISPSDRNNLFRELKELNLNFCLLDVRRGSKLRGVTKDIFLDRIVTDGEANRFFRKYVNAAPFAREKLRYLTTAPEAKTYRVPFMYGLFAFNRQFRNVRQYVAQPIAEATDAQKRALAICALVRAYSQKDFPQVTLARLLGVPVDEVEKGKFLFGDSYGRLIIFTPAPRHARVVHPIIAEVILKTLLAPQVDPKEIIFKQRLGTICTEFLDLIDNKELQNDEQLKEIVTHLFVARSPWEYEVGRKQFSDLMLELENKDLSQRLLVRLTDIYPNEAHFWHHLGRYCSLQNTAEFAEISSYYRKAIELARNDSLHHHGLGFITRDEINRFIRLVKTRKMTFEAAFGDIAELYDSASANFEEARRLDEDSVYPLVTKTQMCLDICEYFKERIGASSIAAIFTNADQYEQWCQGVLGDLHQAYTAYRQLCETTFREATYDERLLPRIERLYGRIESGLQSLRAALREHPHDEFAVRRALVGLLSEQLDDAISDNSRIERAREIFDNLEENYRLHPERFKDIRLWIRSYAQLPEFSFNVAAERLLTWQRLYETVDAFYYAYIIQFLQVESRKSVRIPAVNALIDETRSLARKIEREHSFEWLSNRNTPCPIVQSRMLGKWDASVGFFSNVGILKREKARIFEIVSPAQGYIDVNGIRHFSSRQTNLEKVAMRATT